MAQYDKRNSGVNKKKNQPNRVIHKKKRKYSSDKKKKMVHKESNQKDIKQISAILFAGIFIIVGITMLPSHNTDNLTIEGEETPPGTSEQYEILPEDTEVTYSKNESLAYLRSIDIVEDLVVLEDESLTTDTETSNDTVIDDEYPNIYYELIQDNRICETYWRFTFLHNSLDVYVNAEEQEILKIDNCIYSDGGISTLNDARTEANSILGTLTGLTDIYPTYEYEIDLNDNYFWNGNDFVYEGVSGFSFEYIRGISNYDSTDKVIIDIDGSGNIAFFSKTWNLESPDSTDITITESEAISIADNYLENTTYLETMTRIVRPNYYPLYGMRYGFSEGILVWVIISHLDPQYSSPQEGIFISADTGDVVGGI